MTQINEADRVTQSNVRRGKGVANVEMKCHCVSPSLAAATTRLHLALVEKPSPPLPCIMTK